MKDFRGSAFAILALSATASMATSAHAFVEDLCFTGTNGTAADCYPLPAVCQPAGTETQQCKNTAFAEFDQNGAGDPAIGVRSTIHTDSNFVMAQAVGFSVSDAYWIAAYAGSVDYGRVFVPYGLDGKPVSPPDGGSYATQPLSGLDRLSAVPPSYFVHFITPYNDGGTTPVPGINGLDPDVTNAAQEPELASFRAWAMAATTSTPGDSPMCVAGLTAQAQGNYGSASTCFGGTPAIPGHVKGTAAGVGPIDISEGWDSGVQPIQLYDGGAPVYATDFDTYVGAFPINSDARIGVFIHILGDRVSHHICEDNGILSGPTPGADGGFFDNDSNSDCEQTIHALRHLWEQGVQFNTLDAIDQTTTNALGDIYDQLVAFATARGVLRTGAVANKSNIVNTLSLALETGTVGPRVLAIGQVACQNGYEPFPGAGSCGDAGTAAKVDSGAADAGEKAKDATASTDAGSGSKGSHGDAGATKSSPDAAGKSASTADAASSSGGCSVTPSRAPFEGAWLVGLVALAFVRRRRPAH